MKKNSFFQALPELPLPPLPPISGNLYKFCPNIKLSHFIAFTSPQILSPDLCEPLLGGLAKSEDWEARHLSPVGQRVRGADLERRWKLMKYIYLVSSHDMSQVNKKKVHLTRFWGWKRANTKQKQRKSGTRVVLNQYRNTTEGQYFITKRNQIAKESKKRQKTEVFTEAMTT